ncbi:hypothetical protein LV779_34675 [Streptomyces thinghirensis]|nr:hypothetical protein [Streptomyces thinghirensis]
MLALPLDDADARWPSHRARHVDAGSGRGRAARGGPRRHGQPGVRPQARERHRPGRLTKIDGTVNLLAALDPRALRFAVLFSSVSRFCPPWAPGQSDYAMERRLHGLLRPGTRPRAAVSPASSGRAGARPASARSRTRPTPTRSLLSITNAEGLAPRRHPHRAPRGPMVMPVRVDAARFDATALLDARARQPRRPGRPDPYRRGPGRDPPGPLPIRGPAHCLPQRHLQQ